MSNIYSLVEVSSAYKLDEEEIKKLNNVLVRYSFSGYEGATLILLKEMRYDIPSIIRLLESDNISKKSIFTINFRHKFKLWIKEAIILTDVDKKILNLEFVSATKMSKYPRYRLLNINRILIHRTLNKYGIKYKSKREISNEKNKTRGV